MMNDNRETQPKLTPAEGGPPTKALPAVPNLENAQDSADALPVTKTRATANPKGKAEEAPVIKRLPVQFGRYRLIRELGRGGMGAVVLAEDTQLGRQVALKIPFLKKASDTRTLKRFQREAKAAAALSHPNLCPVFDFGTYNGQHFLSMAYIEGKPLQAFLDAGTLIPQRTVAGLIKKVAQALSHAHERGVIHRDLKPSNIMIEPKLGPIVTDFGLARCLEDEGEPQLTQDGVAIGTPSYMSPEQLEGDSSHIGPQSDIFSLGLICYELLTGQRRFTGKVTTIIGQILTKDPISLRTIRKDIDPQLDHICRKMMARNSAERYASMAEVSDAMRAYLKGLPAEGTLTKEAAESPVDSEPFFMGLPSGEHRAPAPSTQNGAAMLQTEDGLFPPLVISDEDSHSSRTLHQRANVRRPRKPLLAISMGLVAVVSCYLLYRQMVPAVEDPALPANLQLTSQQPETIETRQPSPAESQSPKTSPSQEPIAKQAASASAGNDQGDANDVAPAIAEPRPVSASFLSNSSPATPAKPEPQKAQSHKLIAAKGKIEFEASVRKTINGSTTEKKFATARATLPELTQLERRETNQDAALEKVQVVIHLNGNAFEFSEAKSPRELAAALEEAVPLNIQADEILAKLEYLNPNLADHPPISLSQDEEDRIAMEVQRIYTATYKVLQAQLIFGRSLVPQDEVDRFQFLFEQECQKIKGLPERYPLPKFRTRLPSFGANNPGGSQTYEGDSERFKEQSLRGKILKRIAVALNEGALLKHAEN